jgi:hypothetical protein
MTDDEVIELVKRAEAGERVVIPCERETTVLLTQARFLPRLSFEPVLRRDWYLGLKNGGALIFRAPLLGMSQPQMLQEAVSKALGGESVLVTGEDQETVDQLRDQARSALPNVRVRSETRSEIHLTGSGVLRFRPLDFGEHRTKGFTGEVYLYNGQGWDRGTVPYTPEPRPRNRFERIDNDE